MSDKFRAMYSRTRDSATSLTTPSIFSFRSSATLFEYKPESTSANKPMAPPTAASSATAARTMATDLRMMLCFIYRPPSIL